ncbi:hypothetical protein TTHERM_001417306 (macronuclear) [Tetrahymena thermophila SB210]|uniref:Uncharacterized protein n=1 Tax=Tetrahymena thermophila (strain SB210) TaxID=312017 RepID=W7XGN8_TETTS|nr:hypothetical protein TTHERM_001417306 [Tetrahymena thermophila SB210]EWS72124.1 hypothetical protein TTHERM_001417306 [Tetrahymena thermophila SB210]|eukprot:XP_012655341.1 hypothetical protein TTHERM_001417306 [Tetrahymena thermophila SB210]
MYLQLNFYLIFNKLILFYIDFQQQFSLNQNFYFYNIKRNNQINAFGIECLFSGLAQCTNLLYLDLNLKYKQLNQFISYYQIKYKQFSSKLKYKLKPRCQLIKTHFLFILRIQVYILFKNYIQKQLININKIQKQQSNRSLEHIKLRIWFKINYQSLIFITWSHQQYFRFVGHIIAMLRFKKLHLYLKPGSQFWLKQFQRQQYLNVCYRCIKHIL